MKKIINTLLVLLIVFASAIPCFAATLNNSELPRVIDNAELLSDTEERMLSEKINDILQNYGMDVLILTSNGHEGAPSDEEYIEYVWDNYDFGVGPTADGWAIFICMDCRSWMHDACGNAQQYMSYDSVNIIDDYMEGYMQMGDFYGALDTGLTELNYLFKLGEKEYVNSTWAPDPIVDPDPVPEPDKEIPLAEKLATGAGGGALIGLFAGLISMGSAKKSMRTVSYAYDADRYADRGDYGRSVNLYRSEDILMNVTESRVQKADNRDSGSHHSGGSSYHGSHMSSGGHSHSSGGGRHF